MPPKKVDPKKTGQISDFDLSELNDLPKLNDFIFTTLYAFKYRLSKKKVEKALKMELDMTAQNNNNINGNPDPEFLEAQRRNRVISLKDLLENAELKGYLTKEETEDVGSAKYHQALARSTNDLILSI